MFLFIKPLLYLKRFLVPSASAAPVAAAAPVPATPRADALLSNETLLEQYVTGAPCPQNALDLFRDEWASKLPEPFTHLTKGSAELFDDGRIKWLAQELGGTLRDSTVLELGPLEGGHSHMLERFGAKDVIAIEANKRAYLKCLIVKELLQMQRVRFLCGDFVDYLRADGPSFSICVASGVLYHMRNPAELIALLARRCTRHLLLWSHYYDHDTITGNPNLACKFPQQATAEHEGFAHTLYRYEYQAALNWRGFCGGSAAASNWMNRADLLRCLEYFGFTNFRFNYDDPHHPNGPAFTILADRRPR
jgi:hypothetical protein